MHVVFLSHNKQFDPCYPLLKILFGRCRDHKEGIEKNKLLL